MLVRKKGGPAEKLEKDDKIRSHDFYSPGGHIRFFLPQAGRNFEARIIKAFTPFTNSAVLLLDTSAASSYLPDRVILKLADRRFTTRFDRHWNLDTEQDFQANLSQYFQRHGTAPPGLDDDSLVNETPLWFHELRFWHRSATAHRVECEAYKRLHEAQNLGLIPKLYGLTKVQMADTEIHPSLDVIEGLLLGYVPGRPMGSFRLGVDIPYEEAEKVSQKVLEMGRRLRRYGITHNDIHTDNIILRSPDNSPVLIDWGHAGFGVADAPLEERWNSERVWDDYYGRLRVILKLESWHSFQTPWANEEVLRMARKWGKGGFKFWNERIEASLSPGWERLYEEDKSVDVNTGQ
ncbi:hypothetical protein NLJ89_g3866 [Agrocybe chaxingu]|uniref:Aminoglycoside phosphotransferase domain-containing protein n=1 Tax=Agrocybe chaxingu TaxID=84603 RepID=A0A9W8MV36_9AGAR|nr:hypothetical protein NLJ89_g3866 [Agrocybe chaxingu]